MELKSDHDKAQSEQHIIQISVIKERFRRLHTQAVWIGLTPNDFRKLKSLQDIHKNNRSLKATILSWLIILVTFVLTVKQVNETLGYPLDVVTIARLIDWDFEQENARCLVWNTPKVESAFVPPVYNCDYCRNITTIQKIETVKACTFYMNFSYPRIPVVVTKAARHWKAMDTFSFAFFKDLYLRSNGAMLKSNTEECDFFPYNTNLSAVLNLSEDQIVEYEPWYIGWQNCDWDVHAELKKHFEVPYFIRQMDYFDKLDLWIFMGTPGYGAYMHIDDVYRPTWQAQITGKEEWTLRPASECYFECGPDDLKVTLEPGDIFVVDTSVWQRATRNVGDGISISLHGEFE